MEIVDKLSLNTIRRWFLMSSALGGAITVGLIVFGIDGLHISEQTFLNQFLFYLASFTIAALLMFIISEMILVVGVNSILRSRKVTDLPGQSSQERLEAFYEISQKLILVSDERDVIDFVLRKAIQLSEAVGASYVPLDDYGQPLSVTSMGERPPQLVDEYLEYLASPAVRNRCQNCDKYHTLTSSCNLLDQPIQTANGIFCLPMKRGNQEYGILNLFVSKEIGLSDDAQDYLQAMADQTALAIEAVRLRKKELDALSTLQGEWKKTDRKALLNDLLNHIHGVMNADFSILQFDLGNNQTPAIHLTMGEYPSRADAFLKSVTDGVVQTGRPVVLGEIQDFITQNDIPFSLIVTPLSSNRTNVNGTILVGSYAKRQYTSRQRNLLTTIAGQVSLVLENYQLVAELESKTMLEERSRLARELHDGLAQNLGFLKLQLAQIKNTYQKEDYKRMEEFIDMSYKVVSEAYIDTREAIDGLRIDTQEGNFIYWVEQVVNEFMQINQIDVQIFVSPDLPELSSEIQVQLIRILQEALSNIRKHSQAGKVEIRCLYDGEWFSIEITDDGIGFQPEEVYGVSRHGLEGMHERTDLIGADFNIDSYPDHGTTVRIRLPLDVLEVPS